MLAFTSACSDFGKALCEWWLHPKVAAQSSLHSYSCWSALKHQLLAEKELGLKPLGSGLGTIPWATDHFTCWSISLLHTHLTSPRWVTVPAAGTNVTSFPIKSWETAARTLLIHMHPAVPRWDTRLPAPAQITLPAPRLFSEATAELQVLLRTSGIKWPSAGHLSPKQC